MIKAYATGLSGFLGSHLAKQLDCVAIPHAQIQTTTLQPFDYFFFLSSYGNLASHTDESQVLQANITDLVAIIQQIKAMQFKSFVYVSSSSVKLNRQTLYSRCKKAAEELLLAVLEQHGVPICIVRPFSVTGVGEQPEHLIPTLIRAAHTGETIPFVKEPQHDFIDVDDVVAGILSLAEHGARGVYELGTGTSHSNQAVKELVEQIVGKPIHTNVVTAMRSYDTQVWQSNNFRARSWGWLPTKSLAQSIQEMVVANG